MSERDEILHKIQARYINALNVTYRVPSHNGCSYVQSLVLKSDYLDEDVRINRLPADIQERLEVVMAGGELLSRTSSLSQPYAGAQHWQTANDACVVYSVSKNKAVISLLLEAAARPLDWNFEYHGYSTTGFQAYAQAASLEAQWKTFNEIANLCRILRHLFSYHAPEDVLAHVVEQAAAA